jgi:hypothetical protein
MSHDMNRPHRRERRMMDRKARVRIRALELYIQESGLNHDWQTRQDEFQAKAEAQIVIQKAQAAQ